MLKKDIIELLELKTKAIADSNEQQRLTKHSDEKLKNDLANSEMSVRVERGRLEEIRHSIIAVAAVKFPGAVFEDSTPFTSPVQSVELPTNEPEELLALRHIYSLTSYQA